MSASAFTSFCTGEAGEGTGLQQELWDGMLLESSKLSLSTRFTLTTHICLQGSVEDKKGSQVNKDCKNIFIDLT